MTYPQLEHAKSHEDLHHICQDFIELRERNKGNGTAYGYQCQFCGEFRGGEISKKKVLDKPDWYDAELEEAYRNKIKEISAGLVPRTKTETECVRPNLIDHSSELEKLINKYCEENNINRNSTFKALLIKQRDKYIANDFESIWENEEQLHLWIIENLSDHFEIYREVVGYGFINREKRNVRIDFVLKAKPKLIAHGFTDQFIGVEVKYFSPREGKGFHGKSSTGVFQALSYWYSGARWFVPNEGEVELATVLMFSNISFQEESNSLFDTMDSHFQKTWRAYLSIANHANVGELKVRTRGGKLCYWAMEYNGAKYFSMRHTGEYFKGNLNVINKRRIGSSK